MTHTLYLQSKQAVQGQNDHSTWSTHRLETAQRLDGSELTVVLVLLQNMIPKLDENRYHRSWRIIVLDHKGNPVRLWQNAMAQHFDLLDHKTENKES